VELESNGFATVDFVASVVTSTTRWTTRMCICGRFPRTLGSRSSSTRFARTAQRRIGRGNIADGCHSSSRWRRQNARDAVSVGDRLSSGASRLHVLQRFRM